VPCAADRGGLFKDDEVLQRVALEEVDGHAHACFSTVNPASVEL
jgi:hypothetical protein